MALLESYYTINQAIGLGVTIQKDDSILLGGCQVQVQDQQLEVEKKITTITDIALLGKELDTTIPVALNISGKGVLYKQVPAVEEIGPDQFSILLPSANFEEFYVQHFRSGESSFVAVIRKKDADNWIALLARQGFRVLMMSLGPFPVQHIFPQLNIYGEEVVFQGHRIERNEGLDWLRVSYDDSAIAPFPLKVGNEPIDQQLIMPYAAAFQVVLASRLEVIQAAVPDITGDFDQVIGDKRFRVWAFLILISCFLLLLLNTILFFNLDSENQRLTRQVSSFDQNANDRQHMTSVIKEKETLIHDLGWDGGIRKSSLISQIAALLPPEITWKEVSVNPVDLQGSRNRRVPQFFSRRMEIRGVCAQIIPVNEWIARIKTRNWVKTVQLESYNYDNELNSGRFTLIITY